jgi:hypothetical protein
MRPTDFLQSTYGPFSMRLSPYGFLAMSMKRVRGCASSTVMLRPGPRTAIWERVARLRVEPMSALLSSMYTKAVEVGLNLVAEGSARWQLDVQDELLS